MTIVTDRNWDCFLSCVADLVATPQVQSMKTIPHHPSTSCYEHSVFVAYISFRLARRWGLDYRTAARCGLLHDLYLYNAHDKSQFAGSQFKQCFYHPKAALRNAQALCGPLSEGESNIILSHMWPLSRRAPHSKEAAVVNLADKLCATAEAAGYWRRSSVRQKAMAS